MGQFIYGSYPDIERWRVNLVGLLAIALVAPMFIKGFKYRRLFATLLILVWPIASGLLLSGGVLGLEPVGTQLWGGFMVTLVVAVVGIAASLPIGIALALARRSSLPLIRWLAIAVIEGIRGAPLITILFMASLMLPLFLPAGMTTNGLLRVLVGFSLFAGAYVAEVVRAGLSALPKGQMEAASALGLGYWQTHGLILLPQALRMVIPGIVNTFIALFKDTTLVTIVGIMDLLGAVQAANNDPFWAGPNTQPTGYVVVGVMFWLSCYALSRFSSRLERQLNQNQRRI
jgi:general L-amino acid transport system permease protein